MPDLDRAHVAYRAKERSVRQWCKRLTRLTYAYSKKWEHLHGALSLHFAYYSFCRIHRTLRVTRAMEARISSSVWTLREILAQWEKIGVKATKIAIRGNDGQSVPGSRALIWGNNAAWLCPTCDNLLGNRTGDTEYRVTCSCGARYEIKRSETSTGRLHLGPATGVVRL